MALQGSLKDFSITDIVQLIGQEHKTGTLTISQAKKVVEIYFNNGMIVHVSTNYRGDKDLIGEILVKAKVITKEQLEQTIMIQKKSSKYLGEILVDLNFLDKEDLLKVISNQIYETLYDLFCWREGSFYFNLESVENYERVPIALSTDHVLLNVLRMIDEWSDIEKKLLLSSSIAKKNLFNEDVSKEGVTNEEKMVCQLVNGTRTVQEIIEQSLLGKFHTSEILLSLIGKGVIETVEARPSNLFQKVDLAHLKKSLNLFIYGTIVVFIFILVLFLKPGIFQYLFNSKIEEVKIYKPIHLIHKIQLDRIKNALDLYFLKNGKYPNDLKELIALRLLEEKDLIYGKGIPINYKLKDGEYILGN